MLLFVVVVSEQSERVVRERSEGLNVLLFVVVVKECSERVVDWCCCCCC